MSTSDNSVLDDLEQIAQVETAETDAENSLLKLIDRLASPAESRAYLLDGMVDYAAIRALVDRVEKWVRIDSSLPIHIFMHAHIESFIDALALHDFLRWVRLRGVKVIIQVAGWASGQAAVVLRAADEVYITERSWIHITEVRCLTDGNSYEAEENLKWFRRLQEQQYALLVSSKLSREQLREKIYLKTWFLDAQAAVKFGLVDGIATTSSMPTSKLVAINASLCEGLSEATDLDVRKSNAETRAKRARRMLSQLERRETLAEPARHGALRFIDRVSDATALTAKEDLARALGISSGDLTLLICSPGGNSVAGFGFIDLCLQVRNAGRAINTEVIGCAASMGGVMLQIGKWRVMGKNSWLLIHRVSSTWGYTTSQYELGLDKSMAVQRQCIELLASRSSLTADEILERCRTSDWWLSAEEALEYGFIDEIR